MATCRSGGFVKREGKTDEMNQEPLQSMLFFIDLGCLPIACTCFGQPPIPPKSQVRKNQVSLGTEPMQPLQGKSRMTPAPLRKDFHDESGTLTRMATGAIVMPHLAECATA